MQKILSLLLYGGLPPKTFQAIIAEVDESNRKSVIYYASISLAGFLAILLYAVTGNNPAGRNMTAYAAGIGVMMLLLLLNHSPAKKLPVITRVSAYIFDIAILGIGIMLAASGKNDVTASYMVFLFVVPLLFTLRPLYIDLVIIGSDVAYLLLMHRIQTTALFETNCVNACIYGVLSIFISTAMTRMRLQKFEANYQNRILMETDQLTCMLNRRSYMQRVDALRESGSVAGIKACAFDVNGLKKVNDRFGHHAGDELLRGAAACLEQVFSPYGRCYRIGGDEFIAILQEGAPTVEELKKQLDEQTARFRGTYVTGLSIASGIVEGSGKDTIDELLRRADARMYENKVYYHQSEQP